MYPCCCPVSQSSPILSLSFTATCPVSLSSLLIYYTFTSRTSKFPFFDMLSNFLLSTSVIPFTIRPFTLRVDSPVIFGLSKGQCHEKFVKLRPWGDKLDPSTVFTFFWSAVKSLQFFNCMSSRSKTCLMTFSNCCVSQTNSVFCCCSQLHTNVRTQQCSPPPSPAPALPQCVSYCCGQHTDFNMSQLIPEVAGNCCTLHSVKVWSATTGQLVCMLLLIIAH